MSNENTDFLEGCGVSTFEILKLIKVTARAWPFCPQMSSVDVQWSMGFLESDSSSGRSMQREDAS